MGKFTNPNGRLYGYVRVSTREQNEDRQVFALLEYGVKQNRIYLDKQSGKDFNRAAYKHLIRNVRRGDIIVIKSIDRLGRNYQDIIDQWKMITQDIGVGIHVLDMPTLNTSGDPKDLMSRFITDMMLQVLSFVAENERVNTHQRQAEGLAAAKRRGQKQGRPSVKIPKEFWSWYIVWRRKDLTVGQICKEIKISQRTFYRRIRELDKRYGDFPIDKLESIIINDDIPYTKQFEDLKAMQDAGMDVTISTMPHSKVTRNMRHVNRVKKDKAPNRPRTELDSLRFQGEFTMWWRNYVKRRTKGYLVRTREKERILQDARKEGMRYWDYIDKLVAEDRMGQYCERKGKMPSDWDPNEPPPKLFEWL